MYDLPYCKNGLVSGDYSKYTGPLMCRSLYETVVSFEVEARHGGYRLVFSRPNVRVVHDNVDPYNVLKDMVEPLNYGVYNPDVLGMYVTSRINGLDKGIYLFVKRIIDYWKSTGLNRGLIDPSVLLSLVFYHEYFHMIKDELALSIDYQEEEPLAEFNSLTTTIHRSIMTGIFDKEQLDVFRNPLETVSFSLDIDSASISVNIRYVQQPVNAMKFLELPRITPYSKVVKLWDEYTLKNEIRALLVLALDSDSFWEELHRMHSIRKLLSRIGILYAMHRFLYEKVIGKIDISKVFGDGRNKVVTVNVYLVV